MDLNSLRYFRVVARGGSITAAARELGVSQPTISVAIRNLEAELKTTLFTRTRSGVQLTSTGRALSARADAILSQVEEAVQHLRDLQEDEVGRFSLGCQESLAAYFLPGFLDRFLRECPGIDLDLHNAPSASVRQSVIAREVHFGLVVNCEPHPDLVITPVFRDAVELYVLRGRVFEVHASATREPDLDAARRYLGLSPLIWCDRPVFAELVQRLSALEVHPRRTLVCGDLELVKSLVLEGVGVGVLPGRVARYGHANRLRVLMPGLPRINDVISLVYRGDLHRTRAARRFRDALLGRGRELDVDPSSPERQDRASGQPPQ